MDTRASAPLLLVVLGGAGCITGTERAVPLYDLPTRPGLNQVETGLAVTMRDCHLRRRRQYE